MNSMKITATLIVSIFFMAKGSQQIATKSIISPEVTNTQNIDEGYEAIFACVDEFERPAKKLKALVQSTNTQTSNSPEQICIFQGNTYDHDRYELLTDLLDLKSLLQLRASSKRLAGKISEVIMRRDARQLHLVAWNNGPEARNIRGGNFNPSLFLNYLFNKTVWEAQREVLNGSISQPTLTSLIPLARKIDHLKTHIARLGAAGQDILKLFEVAYGCLITGNKAEVSLAPFILKPITGIPGRNKAERGIALFVEQLLATSQVFFLPPTPTLMARTAISPDLTRRDYYDAPTSFEQRSVVERWINTKQAIAQHNRAVNVSPDHDEHIIKARICLTIIQDQMSAKPLDVLYLLGIHILGTQSAIEPALAEGFYEAIKMNAEEIRSEVNIKRLRILCSAADKLHDIHTSTPKFIRNAIDLCELLLAKEGIEHINDNPLCYLAMQHYDYWVLDKRYISHLFRAIELEERRLTILADAAQSRDINKLSAMHYYVWENDTTKTSHLTRSIELGEKGLAILGDETQPNDINNLAFLHEKLSEIDKTKTSHLARAIELRERHLAMLGEAALPKDYNYLAALHNKFAEIDKNQTLHLARSIELGERGLAMLGEEARPKDYNNLAASLFNLWGIDKTKTSHLARSIELYERRLAMLGDTAKPRDIHDLAASHFNLWSIDKAQTFHHARAIELEERRLAILGDAAQPRDYNNLAALHPNFWGIGTAQTFHLTRSIELRERGLAMLGDAAKKADLNDLAFLHRKVWQMDTTRTANLIRAIELVEKMKNTIKDDPDLCTLLLFSWYKLQQGTVDPTKSEDHRTEAKKLWQKAGEMCPFDAKGNADIQALYDDLKRAFSGNE